MLSCAEPRGSKKSFRAAEEVGEGDSKPAPAPPLAPPHKCVLWCFGAVSFSRDSFVDTKSSQLSEALVLAQIRLALPPPFARASTCR